MKKSKYIIPNLLVVLLSLFLINCSDEENSEVFNESPAERTNAQKQELKTALQSSETGWKAVYFTSPEELGGFTFFFNFLDDETVEMTSDFDDDFTVTKSKYDVVLGSTIKLSFTTKNDIHKLSDSANPPDSDLLGEGYLGDFEFLYYGIDETTGDLIFRTNRTQEELRFTKAAPNEVQNIIDSRNIARELTDSEKSVYQNVIVTIEGTTEVFDFSLNVNRRFIAISNDSDSYSFGIAYNEKGFTVSPPLEIKGQEISEFTYNVEADKFIADLGSGNMAEIAFLDAPSNPTDDNLLVVSAVNRYGFFTENLYSTNTSSINFRKSIDEINVQLAPFGYTLSTAVLNFNIDGDPVVNSVGYGLANTSDGSFAGTVSHFVTYENLNGKLILSDNGWDIPSFAPLFASLDEALLNTEGLYVKEEIFRVQPFTGSAIFTFTSAADPSFRMTTYAFQ
ncbi:hypothetical protein Celal_0770 [Cellulophaga algicola DSM 14237]|uniref:DUF4302 domain-containing protein n=1 Tax=Cellulophaga algicola (strain DSM 14237 / IC166 / ACAM 630) TaxID=688270 RepID=E6XE39_CELAD|nr:DUF4302 domain-containing protein [Cellulophaga algicola]ADV48105.1 hypothetical protein Celal_0770 [Cellulophaga algicola DSM 14237]